MEYNIYLMLSKTNTSIITNSFFHLHSFSSKMLGWHFQSHLNLRLMQLQVVPTTSSLGFI
jgi:hypothetical protein